MVVTAYSIDKVLGLCVGMIDVIKSAISVDNPCFKVTYIRVV